MMDLEVIVLKVIDMIQDSETLLQYWWYWWIDDLWTIYTVVELLYQYFETNLCVMGQIKKN